MLIKDLIYREKETLGLDIGTNSVKFVQLKNAGRLTKLIGYGRVEIPEGIILEGIISEPEKLAGIIKKNFNEPNWGKITAKRIISALPEAKIFTRIIELPAMGAKDIGEAINYEVEQSIPIPLSDLYIDWEIITETNEKITVFLSAAPKSIVDSYVQLFKALGMEPLALEISLSAIARAMVSNKQKVEPVILLDIGGTSSNMAVFDSTLRVTESIPVGGTTIKKSLMELLGKKENEGEFLIREGIKKESKSTEIIKSEVDKFIVEIEKLISYYTEKNAGGKITKILLCGGIAFLPGLAEYIKEKTGIETKVGNPWVNISIYPLKPVPKELAPAFAAAIGLSLRGISNDKN